MLGFAKRTSVILFISLGNIWSVIYPFAYVNNLLISDLYYHLKQEYSKSISNFKCWLNGTALKMMYVLMNMKACFTLQANVKLI